MRFFHTTTAAIFIMMLAAPAARSQRPVDSQAAIVQDFENRVADYMKLRRRMEAAMPALKPTDSPAVIAKRQHDLARALGAARPRARQGAIFTPAISAEFRRLIATAMRGPNAARIRASLRHDAPVHLRIAVNASYPVRAGVPLQSTPPTLLLNLPKLPPQLEYRIVGRQLVLRDSGANLIVDFMPRAIP